MDIAPLPQGPGVPVVLPTPSPEALAAREPPAVIPSAWRIGSYSSLAHGARSEAAAADHDLRVQRETDLPPPPVEGRGGEAGLPPPPGEGWGGGIPPERSASGGALLPLPSRGEGSGEGPSAMPTDRQTRERALASIAPDDILRFPRGARAGECLHAVFERIDFTQPEQWSHAIATVLRAQPPQAAAGDETAWLAMVRRMLADVVATPLPSGHRLQDVPRARRLVELEFSLSANGLDARTLSATLRRHGYEAGALAFGRLDGYLRGFIDLVYEHQGRYYVLDWKSNHLGWSAADYGSAGLRRAMDQQGYHLQYLLYTVALHRYLRQRLRGYAYQKHFGGVNYLFVRGVRPAWTQPDGSAAGVYFHRPERAVVEALDGLLGKSEERRA